METDFHWLRHGETMDEIKEESVEIKEEPIDDMADIRQEDYFNNCSDYANDNIEQIKEKPFDDFADIKQEEPILDAFVATDKDSMESKGEETIDDFGDVKEEELSTSLPIVDVFCPSTGKSRPLTIDLEKGMHLRSNTSSLRHSIMKANKNITVNGPVIVNRDAVSKLDRNIRSILIFPLNAVASSKDPIGSKRDQTSTISDCTTCKYFDPNSDEMNQHIRLRHPLLWLKQQKKCLFCDSSYMIGDEMHNHMKSMHPEEMEKSNPRNDDVIELDRNLPSISIPPLDAVATSKDPTVPKRDQNGASTISDCTTCNYLDPNSDEMKQHIQLRHPLLWFKQQMLKKCAFCHSSYMMGDEMHNHMKSMHPEELKKRIQRKFTKCAFCNSSYVIGAEMALHVQTMHPKEWDMSRRHIYENIARSAVKQTIDGIHSNSSSDEVAQYRAQICDLCGKQASPYIRSPQDPLSALIFFDNLIELTLKQLETAQFFASRNVQVAICTSHCKNIEETEVNEVRCEVPRSPIWKDENKDSTMIIEVPELVVTKGGNKRKTKYQGCEMNEVRREVPRSPVWKVQNKDSTMIIEVPELVVTIGGNKRKTKYQEYLSDSNKKRYDDGFRPEKILYTDEANEESMKEESIDKPVLS